MNQLSCETARAWLPDFVSNRLESAAAAADVEAHLGSCSECRRELDLVQTLFASRATVPDGLADRLVTVVRAEHAPRSRAWWGLSAAAVAALALGIGISDVGAPRQPEVPGYAYEVDEGVLWSSDDGLIAGAPMLEALSDEALAELLDELTAGTSGGAA